jgi:putative ABC transport system permease protein
MLLTLATAAAIAGVQHVAMRRAPRESLLHSGSALTTRTSSRMLDATVVVEMAIAVVVVVSGGLLVRNFVRLQHTDPGFRPNAVAVLTAGLEYPRAADEAAADRDRRVASLLDVLLERASAIAGVEVAALGRNAPLEGSPLQRVSIRHEDGSRFLNGDPRNFAKTPDLHRITPRYFDVLGIPIRAGRAFTRDDDQSRTPVVIVNETMARLHWPGESAIGKRVKYMNLLSASAPWAEVVGIVGDVHSASLHDPSRPELYTPFNQGSVPEVVKIFLKTRGDPLGVVPAARTAIGDVDPRLRMRRIATLREIVDASLSEQQYQAELIALFALLALALASVGVYGLLNYAVARRAREIGIRIALGATSANVAGLVLRRGAMLVIPGLAAGIVVALATTRVMGSLLYGISTTDPLTFVLVPALLIVLAIAAGLAPTRRAASVDPAITLREE